MVDRSQKVDRFGRGVRKEPAERGLIGQPRQAERGAQAGVMGDVVDVRDARQSGGEDGDGDLAHFAGRVIGIAASPDGHTGDPVGESGAVCELHERGHSGERGQVGLIADVFELIECRGRVGVLQAVEPEAVADGAVAQSDQEF